MRRLAASIWRAGVTTRVETSRLTVTATWVAASPHTSKACNIAAWNTVLVACSIIAIAGLSAVV
jgi:hypothetical protein